MILLPFKHKVNKPNTNISALIELYAFILQILVMIFLFPMKFFKVLSEYVNLQNYESMLLCHHLHKKLSNALQLICTHQDLLHKAHPLF